MYKEAAKQKLRIQTTKGLLSVEQLWDLSVNDLDAIAVSLDSEYKESGKKSFLSTKSKSEKDKVAKLKFDIVIDVMNTKVEEAEITTKIKEDKEHNAKIFDIISKKEDKALEGKSIAQLKKELR